MPKRLPISMKLPRDAAQNKLPKSALGVNQTGSPYRIIPSAVSIYDI